jgi:hypothetical protein
VLPLDISPLEEFNSKHDIISGDFLPGNDRG